MLQAILMHTSVSDGMFTFIGDAGAVTAGELSSFVGIEPGTAETWLRTQAAAGYLHRDEFGAYSTSCAWPRIEF